MNIINIQNSIKALSPHVISEPTGVPGPASLLSIVEIPQTGPEGEEIVGESGHGRHNRVCCQIGDPNGCLCGKVVNPIDVNSNEAIECRQPGCETKWVCSTYLSKFSDLHII